MWKRGPQPPRDENEEHTLVIELRKLDEEVLKLKQQLKADTASLGRAYSLRYEVTLDKRRARLALPGGPGGTAGAASSSASSHGEGYKKATPALPGFWKLVLQNSSEFQEDIEEYDEAALEYLRDITFAHLDDQELTGFRMTLHFEPNPFFTQTDLTKVYHTSRKSDFIDRLACVRIEAPTITWRPGKNVTVETVMRKPKDSRSKHAKARREEVSRPSFFRTFFRNLGPDQEIPEEEMDEQYGDSEEDAKDLMMSLLAEDYEQALALRESIVPHAIRWFTGDACDDDDDDDAEEEEEEEEEDDDDSMDCGSEDGERACPPQEGGRQMREKRRGKAAHDPGSSVDSASARSSGDLAPRARDSP